MASFIMAHSALARVCARASNRTNGSAAPPCSAELHRVGRGHELAATMHSQILASIF